MGRQEVTTFFGDKSVGNLVSTKQASTEENIIKDLNGSTMNLKLLRKYKKETYTIGELYINGEFFCSTLEDKDRGLKQSSSVSSIQKIKVPNQTAIPTGTYEVVVNKSPRFGRMLPRLLNVPGFDGVLIHRGNTDKDTSGCILVGENKVVGKVINSTPYETKLVSLLAKAQSMGEKITIEIV